MKLVLRKTNISKKQGLQQKTKQEEKSMKKIIPFSEAAKKYSVLASTSFLMAFAMFFAAAPCYGRLHEPEVPKKLQ